MVLSGLTFHCVIRRAMLAFSSLLYAVIASAQPAEVAGTMPEDHLPELKRIMASALQRSPMIIGPLFEMELRDAQRIRERSALLPSFGGNFNYGSNVVSESGSNSSQSRDQGLFYNFGLNQALFHWGALKNQNAIGRINLLIAEKSFERAYRELAVLLRQSYMGLIVQKSRVRQTRGALQLLTDTLVVLRERLGQGGISAAEVTAEEMRIREVKLEVTRAETEFLNLRTTFARIAGIGSIDEAAIPDEIPNPNYSNDLASAIGAALLRDQAKSTLEAEIHELRVREALHRYKIENVRLLPKFSFGAGYSLENNTTVNGNAVGQRAVARQTLSISGSWNIFDGLATRAAKMEARATQRLQMARRDAELQALLESAQALERLLKVDAEQLELVEIRRGLAVETRRRAEEEFGFGNLAKSDIAASQIGILQADTRLLEARAALFSRWSEFVALATEDPILNNVPDRNVREKK